MVQLSHLYRAAGKTIALTAAAAKLIQSCQTLCEPMDCSPPGSVHGIFQARVLEWGAIAFSVALTKWTFFRAIIKSVITEEMSKDNTDKAIARALPVERSLKLNFFFLFLKDIYRFIYLFDHKSLMWPQVFDVLVGCFNCRLWDLAPSPAWGARSLCYWTTHELPTLNFSWLYLWIGETQLCFS